MEKNSNMRLTEQFPLVSNEKGYTLFELLLVLLILMMLLSLSTFFISKRYFQIDKTMFLTKLQQDLLYTQAHAISHQHGTTLLISSVENKYYIYGNPSEVLKETTFSKDITLRVTTQSNPIRFSYNGNISRAGKLIMTYKGKEYVIVMYLGKGRFYVQE